MMIYSALTFLAKTIHIRVLSPQSYVKLFRKVPEYLTAKVVEFSKIKPQDRFRESLTAKHTFLFPFFYDLNTYKCPSRSMLTLTQNLLWNPPECN